MFNNGAKNSIITRIDFVYHSHLSNGYSTSDVTCNTSGLSVSILKKKKSSEVDFIIFLSVTAGETETFGEVTHLLSKSAFQICTYLRHLQLLPSLP